MPVMVRPAQGQDWYEFFLAKQKSHVYVSAPRYWLQQNSGSNLKEELASIDFGGKSRLINWPDLNPQTVQRCHPSTRKRGPTQTPMHTHGHDNHQQKPESVYQPFQRRTVAIQYFVEKAGGQILHFACEAISSDALWREFTSFTLARPGKNWWWQLECTLNPTLGNISASCFYDSFFFLVIPCFRRLL